MPHLPAKTQISAPCSDERPWCQTPSCARGGGGTGWFLTGLTGLRATEGTRKARKSRGERGGERGNSDWWQGYANAPPHHCITSGTCCVLSLCALCSLWQKLWKLGKIYLCIKDFTTQTHNQTTCAMPTPISSKLPPMSLALNLQNVRAHTIIQRQQ